MDAMNEAPASSQSCGSERSMEALDRSSTPRHCTSEGYRSDTGSTQTRELIDLMIQHLSASSNEALLCLFICLMGATYALLGRFGLVLIGLLSGIFLHSSWEGLNNGDSPNPHRRRELSLNIANKLLDWSKRNHTETGPGPDDFGQHFNEDIHDLMPGYSSFGPETAAALNTLTEAIIRDYVNHWYEPILPSETTFPHSCRSVLTAFVTAVALHLARKRTADTFLEFLTNSSSMIIVFLSELSTAFEIAGPSTKPEEAIQRYLELYRESSLANVLSTHQQQKKLNIIADDILSNFLDSTAYACPPLRSFLREILSGIVLESTISNLSRPETINSWIIYLLSEGESGIMSAIDAGVEGARNDGVTTASRCHMDTSLTTSFDSFDLKSKSPIKAYQGGPDYADKATEEAITEAKRLSAMIAAQDLQSQSFDQTTENSSGSQTSQHVDGFSPGSTIDAMKDKPVPEVQRRVEVPEAKMDGTPSQMSIEQGATRESGSSSGLSVRSSSLEQPLLLSSPLTLHRAFVSIHDGSESSEEIILRSKPTSSYLLQIEPSSAPCTGWMVFRNYADFESLHETLEAISRLNKIQQFSDAHSLLPTWKRLTSRALANNLERYLQDALQYEPLAECERMRRFLEKEGPINHETKSSTKSSFFPSQAALENVGKGVLGVLTNAPKSVSGGRNAVFSGMAGVFGAGPSKNTVSSLIPANSNTARFGDSFQIPPGMSGSIGDAVAGPLPVHHESQEHAPTLPESSSTRPSVRGTEHLEESVPIDLEGTTSSATENASSGNDFSSDSDMVLRIHGLSEATQCLDEQWRNDLRKEDFVEQTTTSGRGLSSDKNLSITQDETRVAVELIFAVINELYMLSSAWNIRRTLLNAAKTYMLRPGNPNLETIRGLLQNSMLDANTSDQALARYIVRLRENALPTESELESWPSPPNDAEKERLRQTARRILVQKGLPQTLTGVMGAAASREALEKVFDCLQVQSVAKGFVFSIVVQALKAVTL